MYNMYTLTNILKDSSTMLQWLRDVELIPKERYCRKHKRYMILYESKNVCRIFHCQRKGKYNHEASVAENTWFERCHTSATCIIITYCFSVNMTYGQIIRESSIIANKETYRKTVADRLSYCREVCMLALDAEFEEQGLIGGPNEIVEVNECKIGRRKYHRSRVVEGCWILEMIHRGHPTNYRLEICPENKRDKDTLLNLIRKHVAPGTEIHTDCWKGYFNLNDNGYIHETVNHSKEFVNSETGAHTQNIELSWRWMRRQLSRGGVHSNNIADHMCEFMWHRRVRKLNIDPFEQLLKDVKKVYPGKIN
ncbi:unnamed protein product [Lasius platythorax]|uniref:ISXO2-like transposase domain-containing protein n=1 Tax=Lasius platythorax TaxID=488582 RepID=A0AAV2MX64_9HYME